MIAGLDSAQPPSAAQVAAARAAGVGLWSGYLATAGQGGSAFGLLRVWTEAEFEVAKALPGRPIAFASGWDDPLACRGLAAAWNVRLCLDVEDGIRGDGPWVQSWLDASGAGLYGNLGVHFNRVAAFHILSYYPGRDPAATFLPQSTVNPYIPSPWGWQWQGSHQEFGLDVDRGWYDDWFGGEMLTDAQQAQLDAIENFTRGLYLALNADSATTKLLAGLAAVQTALAGLPQAQIQPALDAIARLQADVTAIRARTDKDLG